MRGSDGAEVVRALLVPILQTVVLLASIISVTVLGQAGIVDAPAITAIVGAIVGSVGVLAGVAMTTMSQRNGRSNGPPSERGR